MGSAPASPSPAEKEAWLAEHAAIDREEAELMRLQLTLPGWLKANPWFDSDVLPELRAMVRKVMDDRTD